MESLSDSDGEDDDPSALWPDVHRAVRDTIDELGGNVVPKLNWSAPKDATWMSTSNSMECRSANEVYLLLKSSDFVTHDLEHAFDGCIDDEESTGDNRSHDGPEHTDARRRDSEQSLSADGIPYFLVLRKFVQMNPSVEFRCFVRNRTLVGICQRDLNHYDFLFKLRAHFGDRISHFFRTKLRDSFPDADFVFDVYIPPVQQRVWLIDINPWARRTDSILFDWSELLTMAGSSEPAGARRAEEHGGGDGSKSQNTPEESTSAAQPSVDESTVDPEFRLVRREDPEAYNFSSAQYSGHKLPRDVVDASSSGPGGMREFAEQWKEMLHKWENDKGKEADDSMSE